MTKEDWKIVVDTIGGVYGTVELDVDGHLVTFRKVLVTPTKLKIMTYIDGSFQGKWLEKDGGHPESRYLNIKSRYAYSPRLRAIAKKQSKRVLKECGIDYDRKIEMYYPFWLSVTSIRRHYQKTFASIKLTKVNGVAFP